MEEDTLGVKVHIIERGLNNSSLEKWIGARNVVRRVYPFLKSSETVFRGWLNPVTLSHYGQILLILGFPTPSVRTILQFLLTASLRPNGVSITWLAYRHITDRPIGRPITGLSNRPITGLPSVSQVPRVDPVVPPRLWCFPNGVDKHIE